MQKKYDDKLITGHGRLADDDNENEPEERKKNPLKKKKDVQEVDQVSVRGYLVRFKKVYSKWPIFMMAIIALYYFCFSILSFIEASQKYFMNPFSLKIAYVVLSGLALILTVIVCVYDSFLTYSPNESPATPRHNIDIWMTIPVSIATSVIASAGLFTWDIRYGHIDPNPAHAIISYDVDDNIIIPDYSPYLMWNFNMMFITMSGFICTMVYTRAIHSLGHPEGLPQKAKKNQNKIEQV